MFGPPCFKVSEPCLKLFFTPLRNIQKCSSGDGWMNGRGHVSCACRCRKRVAPTKCFGWTSELKGRNENIFFFFNPKKKRKAQLCVVMDAKFVADYTLASKSKVMLMCVAGVITIDLNIVRNLWANAGSKWDDLFVLQLETVLCLDLVMW